MKKTALPTPAEMPAALSLYFDLARLLAAISVVLYHTWTTVFPESTQRWPGHEAVVVFFVLSGYVIAFTATRPGMTLSEYFRHRCARVLPVAYAALLLSLVVAVLLDRNSGALVWPTVANMLFVAQSGTLKLDAPLNSPFWSLNYEVWYYVIFAAWTFAVPKWRVALTALAMLLAGPKILLLLPVWLMGVWLLRVRPQMERSTALALFSFSFVVAAVMFALNLSETLRSQLYTHLPFMWRAHYSTQLLYDYLLGIMVSVNFAAVSSLSLADWFRFLEKPIRYLASFTFSMYLFHVPLGTLLHDVMGIRSPLAYYGAMAACIFVLGQLTERRVRFYRALFASVRRGGPAAA
jgi:peptidoglycan/LPS O-acetylase OafA/YrhL